MNRHTHTHPHTHTHTHTHTHKCMFTSVLSTNVCHNANRTSVIYVLTGQKATTSIWMMMYLYRCLRIFMIMCLYWLFSTDDLSMKTSWVQSHLFLFTTFNGFHSFILEPVWLMADANSLTWPQLGWWDSGARWDCRLVEQSVIKAHRINKPPPHKTLHPMCLVYQPHQTSHYPHKLHTGLIVSYYFKISG